MLDLISKILSVASSLFGLRSELRTAGQVRRSGTATLFDDIAACLEKVATELIEVKIPHGCCAELQTYALELPAHIAAEVGVAKAKELGALLEEAHNVERLLCDLKNAPDPEGDIVKLWAAAGQFRALANLLRH